MPLKISDKLKSVRFSKDSAQGVPNSKEKVDIVDSTDIEHIKEEPTDAQIAKSHELQEKVLKYLTENSDKLKKWYSDNHLEDKIQKVAKKAGATIIYPVLLLFNILKSPDVKSKDKMRIIVPLAYFILPADIIPDFILGLGYVDDGFAVLTALKTFSSSITPAISEQTQNMCKNIIGEASEEVVKDVLDKVIQKQEDKQ